MSIWNQKQIKQGFSAETKFITLNEGSTKVDRLDFNNIELLIKREDLNPSGSWKDRGSAFKLTSLLSKNINEAVLFSSGNALISLLKYIKELELDFTLHSVVSNKINSKKLELLEELVQGTSSKIYKSSEPKKEAIQIAAEKKIPNLRISLDNEIVKGYWTLGFELYELIRNRDTQEIALFIPASSGTAAVGIAEGLFMKLGNELKMPKIFICQTSSVHPFADGSESEETSLADAIVDSVGLRKSQIQKITTETNGEVLVITDEELEEARALAVKNNLQELSYNSLLSIAGLMQISSKLEGLNKAICLASGR